MGEPGGGVRLLEPVEGLRCAVAANPGPMTLDGTRNYLVGESEAVLLDPGPEDEGQEERIRALVDGRRVTAVCLTHAHPDHAGGASRLARALDAPLAASRSTLERIDAPGRALEDGDAVTGGGVELRALETPGHSADHLCYLWSGRRAVFTGDLVLGEGTAMVGDPDGHMGSYLESLERLIGLRPGLLLPGHGGPVEDAVERLREYRAHRLEREEQVRAAVEEGAASVAEIRRRVYGDLPGGLAWAAEASIRAHLRHLEEQGHDLPELEGREGEGPPPH